MCKLRFSFEYRAYPVWKISPDGGVSDLDHNLLPISKELKQLITIWDNKFQDTYIPDDPASSNFKSIEEEKLFIKEGLILFKRLKDELPDNYRIVLCNCFKG